MKVSTLVQERVTTLAATRRIVVWYDRDRHFQSLIDGLNGGDLVVIDAGNSILQARRRADECFRALDDPHQPDLRGRSMVIYCPRKRPARDEERLHDPFECYAAVGETFGDRPADSLHALARQAHPGGTRHPR